MNEQQPSPQPATQVIKDHSDAARAGRPTVSLATIAALAMVVAFWLPWISGFLMKPSGSLLAQQPGYIKLLWLIPIGGVLTILAGLSGSRQQHIGQISGSLPFLALAYVVATEGTRVMNLLELGAYITLAAGAVLMFSPALSRNFGSRVSLNS